jgi:hypothetical protein
MTVLNHAQSAVAVVVAAADTSSRSARQSFARRLRISSLATLMITAGVSGLSTASDARGVTGGMTGGGGSTIVGSSITGRMVTAPTSGATSRRSSGLHARSMSSIHRFGSREGDIFVDDDFDRFHDFRRFHHRHHRDFLDDRFFPFGFFGGWPSAEPDLSAAADDGSDDGDAPSFRRRGERYESPTVEQTPSGVTIIRGPGSHRF